MRPIVCLLVGDECACGETHPEDDNGALEEDHPDPARCVPRGQWLRTVLGCSLVVKCGVLGAPL